MALENERLILQKLVREEKEKLGDDMSFRDIGEILGKGRTTISGKINSETPPSIEMSLEILSKALNAKIELKVNGVTVIKLP